MHLLKPLSIAICTGIAALTAAQADDDTPTNLHFFDENFEVRHAKADSDDFTNSLANTRIPHKCIDDITKGKASKSRECDEWIKANPDFGLPSSEPTTAAPTPFFHVSSTFKETATDSVMEVKLKPTDDTFIEVWRPDEPLGDREKLKIDAIDGIPTKVIMMKFGLGHVLREYHDGDTHGINATLTGAKLRLFAITDTHFGGWVQEIDVDWDEETAVWDDYVSKGKRGSYEKEAAKLLPERGDVIGKFGNVTAGSWYEADLSERLIDIFDGEDEASGQLTLRLTTDSADGVIYASKEYEGYSPELRLDFTFTGGDDEDAQVLEQNMIEMPTSSPTVTPKDDATDTLHPSGSPSSSPISITHFPTASPNSSVDSFAVIETDEPTPSPTRKPTQKPSKSPVAIEQELVPSVEDSTISVVSSSFKMTITAIEELFRARNLRLDNRDLNVFMSVDEKERPALKKHLLHVSKVILDNPPEDLMLSFEDDVVVETIEKSNKDNGGVIRTSTFRVIGKTCSYLYSIQATFLLTSLSSTGEFNEAENTGATTAQLAGLLDQTITYAFVGFQKKSFLEILSNTGRPINSRTSSQDVSVAKVTYDAGKAGESISFATDQGNGMASQTEDSTNSGTWIQPTLIAGAALLFVATASASLIVFRLKHSNQQSADIQGKPTSDESPRSLEETAVPSTPSPAIFADRWKKKKFDYSEFHDDPDIEDSACAMTPTGMSPTTSKYLDQPARDIKFSQFMSTSFEDSSVSDVSGHMLGAKGSMKENGAAKEESSQAESFLLDTTMDSYNMDTMSELNARLENVLQLDGASPRENMPRVDDASHMTVNSAVPSELYSDINTSTDSPIFYEDIYDTRPAYASHLITLDMMKNNDMPPPPSDAASDSSSYQDDKLADIDQNLHFDGPGGAEERLIQNAKSNQVEDVCSKTKSEMINDELSKVMKLLQTPSKDGADTECYGSPESSAEIYIQSESDTESVSLLSSVSVLDGITREIEAPTSGDGNSVSSTEALNNTAPFPQDRKSNTDGVNALVNGDLDSENEENDPLQAMNVALNECIQILDKAAAQD